jgi:predicted nucleic acid-binding protein
VKEVYAETSAVLGWLLGEKGSERFSASIDAAGRVLTSVLTILESNRGILRAGGEGRISQAKAARLKGLLARIAAQWYLMEVTEEVRRRAAERFPVEPIRTLDAVHLATILEFATAFPELPVLSTDRRILANLEPLGLLPAASRP